MIEYGMSFDVLSYNCFGEIITCILSLILIFNVLMTFSIDSRRHKFFLWGSVSSFAAAFCDIVSVICITYYDKIPLWLDTIVTTIFFLLLCIGILRPGLPHRQLLFLHVLFLLQNHFVQIVKIQNKQNITLLYLLAFIDANAGNSQATNRGYCQLLVLNGFTSDLHSMVDGSAGRHFRGHHSRTMLINSSGKNGEKNHRPEEQSDPLPNAYLFFFQIHN